MSKVVFAFFLACCFSNSGVWAQEGAAKGEAPKGEATPAAASPAPTSPPEPVAPQAKPSPAEAEKPGPTKKKPGKKGFKNMFALLDTSKGKIKLRLFYDRTPETVNNFVDLAEGTKEWKDPASGIKKKSHFYDGLTFHRIIKNFMIQGGDPLGNGMGGPGYQFNDEIYPDLQFDREGVLAMANSGKNTNGSQFFITVAPTSWLNGKYTIFGEVVEGMDVVKKISETATDKMNDSPFQPIKINKVTIQRK